MEDFQDKLEEQYGKESKQQWIAFLNKISILLVARYNPELRSELQKEKAEVEKKLDKMKNNQKFVQEMTQEKYKLTKEIKKMDEMLNNKDMLQEEYEKRNEFLPLQEKIFSSRILSKMLVKERKEKIKSLEKVNNLLNPQKFVTFKKELEDKEKYLKLLDIEDLEKEITNTIIEMQKIFLLCYQTKIQKIATKQELVKLIYEFRYYCLIPFSDTKAMNQVEELRASIQKIEMFLLEKSHQFKLIDIFSKEREMDYQILKSIFHIRVINLEDLYIKVIKEKENYYVQLFDEDVFEEKIKIESLEDFNKKEVPFKLNKKIKVFN